MPEAVAPPPDPPITPERHALMSRVRQAGTKPEMIVRRTLHALGYRYRLHDRRLPGSPDIVFPSKRVVIFVHGCFWHRHPGCRLTTTPKARAAFWSQKFADNEVRDARDQANLAALGWRVHVVWECEARSESWLADALVVLGGQLRPTP
jgi:DNA mismatch endonuclease (patch repair protein)